MSLRIIQDKLSTNLGLIKNKIEIENSSNNQSLNVIVESSFLEILNIIYGYELENPNALKSNFDGIDGFDPKNRVMVQISSTNSFVKVEKTLSTIINKTLFKDFDKLFFVLLKDKKNFNNQSLLKIENIIDGKFHFDIKDCFLDLNDIYRLLVNSNDITKITKVNEILERILFDIKNLPDRKVDYLGLSFDKEELDNVINLVEIIIKQGINIVTISSELYQFFEKNKSNSIDNLILLREDSDLNFLKRAIVIVSNKFIKNNIDNPIPDCKIFTYCLNNDIGTLQLSFSDFTDEIKNRNFKNPRFIKTNNGSKIEELIRKYLTPKSSLKYSFSHIKDVLRSFFPTFKLLTIVEEKYFSIYNFSYNKTAINFLIFSHEYRRSDVITRFNKEYRKKYSTNLIILLPKDYNQTTKARIKYIKDTFPNATVQFIDEYLYENSLKNVEQENLLLNDVFISPFFKINGDIEKLEDVFDWLKNDESSVAFIIGSGGDGKTTVCQKIHDNIIQDFENNIVVFLEAQPYIEEITNREKTENWKFDLQTVFEISNTQIGGVDLNTFKSNFTFGNITVIIDGIDEVISTLPNFNLRDFLEDFSSLREEIGRGKLIINCRDIYIDEILKVDEYFDKKHKVFTLLKFDIDLVTKYFNKHFQNDLVKVKNGIKLLNEFYDNTLEETYIYSPFVLEIIATIIDNDFNYEEIEYYFDSKILLKNNANDYLIYKICKREIAKKEIHGFVIPVDDYIRLLGLIAIEKNGKINDEDFSLLLKKLNIDLNGEEVKKSLRDNPFFCLENSNYYFRFDFYNLIFKYDALFSKIFYPESFELTDSLITVISKDLRYNSLLFEGLKNKFSDCSFNFDQLLLQVKLLIIEIERHGDFKSNSGYHFIKHLAISNLVVFLSENRDKNYTTTDIICKLFSGDEIDRQDEIIPINNLYLIDIPGVINFKIDFSGMFFTDTIIENFTNFFECNFSQDTFFDNTCRISKISNDKLNIKKCSAKKSNFHNHIISSDNSLFKAISLVETGGENILSFLRKFLRCFQKGSKLIEKVNVSQLPFQEFNVIKANDLNQILFDTNIIADINKDDIIINSKMKLKILKFVNQNVTFSELNKAIKEIEKRELNG